MYRSRSIAVFLCALTALVSIVSAENDPPEEQLQQLVAGLRYQQGNLSLKDGLANLHVPENFRFLDAKDSQTVLTKIWGNPPSETVLGMVVPAEMGPEKPNSWAVILQYEEEGYVKDGDAAKINYDDLLKTMREQAAEANKQRQQQGYPTVELIGWAAPPRYDQATHKLYWAKELKFAEDPANTLNYNIRMLGRLGVLVLNVVAGMDRLNEIDQATPALLQMVDFQEGHRYTDFNPKTDKVATYGLVGLIAGGVLAKAGFFKLLFAGLLAAKKLVVVGCVAAFAFLKRLFGGRNEQI